MNRSIQPTRHIFIWIGLAIWLVGCVNLDVQTMPPNSDVKPAKTGESCAYAVILPFLIGTLTVEEAMAHGNAERIAKPEQGYVTIYHPIARLHSLTLQQFSVPFYTSVCLVATGE